MNLLEQNDITLTFKDYLKVALESYIFGTIIINFIIIFALLYYAFTRDISYTLDIILTSEVVLIIAVPLALTMCYLFAKLIDLLDKFI